MFTMTHRKFRFRRSFRPKTRKYPIFLLTAVELLESRQGESLIVTLRRAIGIIQSRSSLWWPRRVLINTGMSQAGLQLWRCNTVLSHNQMDTVVLLILPWHD
jgi:hypothetical protein